MNNWTLQILFDVKPLSQWEVSSGDLELTRCKSAVKAICVGLANSANYSDQWSDATLIRRKLHWKGKLFSLMLALHMLQSRVISEAFFTFFLSVSLRFVSIERDFKGFTFHVSYFNLRQWWAEQTIGLRLKYCPWWDVLVVPPRDYQLRHLAVFPLDICLVRQRPE